MCVVKARLTRYLQATTITTIPTLFWLFHIHILKFQIWSHQMSHMIRWCYPRWQHYFLPHFPPISSPFPADSHRKFLDALYLGPIFFIFLQFSIKFGQIKCWCPSPSGKSWIHHLWEILDTLLTLLRKFQKLFKPSVKKLWRQLIKSVKSRQNPGSNQ